MATLWIRTQYERREAVIRASVKLSVGIIVGTAVNRIKKTPLKSMDYAFSVTPALAPLFLMEQFCFHFPT